MSFARISDEDELVHIHGEHTCYCPNCAYEETVEEGQKCNLLICPGCGSRLRAVSTGEYYGISQAPAGDITSIVGFFTMCGILAFFLTRKN